MANTTASPYIQNTVAATAPAPNPQNTSQNKTPDIPTTVGDEIVVTGKRNKDSVPTYAPASEKNKLSEYRSYTYNFAIGAVPVAVVNGSRDLSLLDNAVDDFHILDSAGKAGNNGGGISIADAVTSSSNVSQLSSLISDYNSAIDNTGFFDLYMDDLVIDSVLAAGNPQGASSAATTVEFTVIEPYSINGFIEALTVASAAAGYDTYLSANFCLRVRFQGYRDDASLSSPPEIVPKSTRYFIFSITSVDLSISENGSKYRVSAVPFNQKGLGQPNIQLGDINVSGDTVYDVLKNYFKRLNESSENNAKKASDGKTDVKVVWDRYEISAPTLVSAGQQQDVIGALVYSSTKPCAASWNSKMNSIVTAKTNPGLNANIQVDTIKDDASKHVSGTSLGKSNIPPPGTHTPTTASFPFKAGQQIHESISTLVRYSDYVIVDVLQNQLPKAKASGSDKMITYFTIRMETEISDKDEKNNRYTYIYRYVLEPYKMTYLNIPSQEQGVDDHTTILDNIKREFNYLFTGKNTEVLKFDLKFDNLYYSGIPKMFGNTPDAPTAGMTAGATNKDKVIQSKSASASSNIDSTVVTNPAGTTSTPAMATDPIFNTYDLARSGMIQNDPYYKLAEAFHKRIIDSVDKVTGDLEIMGDPYFFVTGTSAMADLHLDSIYETNTGEAPVTQGDLVVLLTFKNPIDIYKGNAPGLALFSTDKSIVAWSGIYRVIQVTNNFKEGIFTQVLNLIRCPGQVLDSSKTNPANMIGSVSSPIPGAKLTKDTADSTVNKTGITQNIVNIGNLLNRGFPSVVLPGDPTDFTSSLLSSRSSNLTQYSGAVSSSQDQLGVISGASATFGAVSGKITDLNVSPAALNPSTVDSSAALLSSVGTLMSQTGNITNAASALGATISSQASNITNNVASSGASVSSQVSNIGNNLQQSVSSIANQNPMAVGNVGAALASLQTSMTSDLSGIASKLGISTSALSGLGNQLTSKITNELTELSSLVPTNTSLEALDKSGVLFKDMTGIKLPNLPAVQPSVSAPAPIFDPARVAITDANGNIIPLLNGQAALADLTANNNITNTLGQTAAGLSTNFMSNTQAILDKVGVVNLSANNVASIAPGVTANVGSLLQNSVQSVMPAMAGLGSVESNLSSVQSLVQSSGNLNSSQLGITLNSQLGSSQGPSALATLVQQSNNQGTLI